MHWHIKRPNPSITLPLDTTTVLPVGIALEKPLPSLCVRFNPLQSPTATLALAWALPPNRGHPFRCAHDAHLCTIRREGQAVGRRHLVDIVVSAVRGPQLARARIPQMYRVGLRREGATRGREEVR